MKYIHFPTLAVHGGLLLLAAVTLDQYHDAFLPIAAVVLIAHAVWCARSERSLAWTHMAGCIIQFAVFLSGAIEVSSIGGEFSLFFYEIALGVSCAVELIIALVKSTRHKAKH